jgi:hypothetical protein
VTIQTKQRKNKVKNYIKWTISILAMTRIAHAEPTLYPKDLTVLSNIQNTTDSNILADEKDSKTVWVMPPNTAQATVSGLHTKTANMGFCAEMRDLKDASKDSLAQIVSLEKAKASRQLEFAAIQKTADDLAQKAAAYAADSGLSALLDLDNRIQTAEARLSELYSQNDKCTGTCDQIQAEMKTVIASKYQMMKDRNALASLNTTNVQEYRRRQSVANAAQKAADNAKNAYTDMVNELFGLKTRFQALFSSYGQMEGARAAISYKSSWNDNVASLRAANPGINFSKIATKNANLMTEIAGISIDPQGAIKAINFGGKSVDGAAQFPAYPESLSSNVVLSLIGACPMEHPEYFDMKSNDVQNMQYGVMITYDYDSIFTTKAIVHYNMYKMYQKIISSGTKSGFFNSSSWSSVQESNFFRDSFSVEWDVSENLISADVKQQREEEMRQSVLFRLATLALPNSPNRAEIIAAAQPPKHGAIVLSDGLEKTCPTNAYCQGAAIMLQVLDAIFGSSSSNASYTNITDINSTDNYSETGKITKSWITSYLHP